MQRTFFLKLFMPKLLTLHLSNPEYFTVCFQKKDINKYNPPVTKLTLTPYYRFILRAHLSNNLTTFILKEESSKSRAAFSCHVSLLSPYIWSSCLSLTNSPDTLGHHRPMILENALFSLGLSNISLPLDSCYTSLAEMSQKWHCVHFFAC